MENSRQKLFLPVRFLPWKKPFFPPTGKNLPTLIQMFENDINCADITVKSCHVKISHTVNQLLTLS